jgi:hypothetical protein
MFGFMKNNEANFQLVNGEREKFVSILRIIFQLLNKAGHNAQADFIQKIIELMNQQNISLFVRLINSVDMWGGAGAVWEVHIENKVDAKTFENEMLRLIYLMEQTKVLGKGIKPIRRIFENDLRV